MKILKESGRWLNEQIESNEKTATIFLIIGLATLIFATLIFYSLGIIFIVISIYFIVISIYFFIKSGQYHKGKIGEILVEEHLKGLSDNYCLINDIMLPESYGNIDHIILGPNGIFVIESKNYGGKIICDGDEWHRHYEGGLTISMRGRPYWKPSRDYDIGSPSKQVKRNAVKLKQIIEPQKGIFKRQLKLWVEGIVVFTNSTVDLKLNNPTVSVLKVEELYDYVKNKKSWINFSPKELDLIGNLILRRAKGNFN